MTRERVEEYVRAGEGRGVTRIALTEHLFRFEEAYRLLDGWWEDDPDPSLGAMAQKYWQDHVSGSIADYVRLVESCKSAGLPVLLGLEMDWLHGRADALQEFLAPYDWDIVLGSVHYIGAWGFDDPRFLDEWKRRDVAGAWSDYGTLVEELAQSGLADVLAHPDLPKVMGYRPADETPLHDTIIRAASSAGLALEMNSNGVRRCQEAYPAPPLLRRARESGLQITLASDAHTPERVGAEFARLRELAVAAGYGEASWFRGRERVAYPIT